MRIGCNLILATSFVSAVVERLSRRFPRILFNIVARPAETLHRELNERNVDLLVARRLGPIADERLGFERLFDEREVVAAGAQNRWARRRRMALADLMNEPWVLPPADNVIGAVVLRAFRARGCDYPRTTVVSDSPHVRLGLVAGGRFLSIFAASALRFPAPRPDIKILPVELPLARMPIGVVTLRNRVLSPVARLFVEMARDVAKPLAG